MKIGDVVKIKNNVDCDAKLKYKYHIIEDVYEDDAKIQGTWFNCENLTLIAEQSKLIEEIIPTRSISLVVSVVSKAEATEIGRRISKGILKELDNTPYIAAPNNVSITIAYAI